MVAHRAEVRWQNFGEIQSTPRVRRGFSVLFCSSSVHSHSSGFDTDAVYQCSLFSTAYINKPKISLVQQRPAV